MAENTKTNEKPAASTKADVDPAPLVKLHRDLPIGANVMGQTKNQNPIILPDLTLSNGTIIVTADAILAAAALVAEALLNDQLSDTDKLSRLNRVYNWLGYEDRPTLEDATNKQTLMQVLQDVLAKNAFSLHPLNAHVI